jgi:hypothetical protein
MYGHPMQAHGMNTGDPMMAGYAYAGGMPYAAYPQQAAPGMAPVQAGYGVAPGYQVRTLKST